ncbi:MAG TPA: hypothetical protein VN369_07415 [Terriglobales bacterium]|nr:hypothetical protein [Terriglobales bacterium]
MGITYIADIGLGALSLGLLWGIMTIGVFITYRVLDYADLTVEGSITTGASVAASLMVDGVSPVTATAAAMCAGMCAGLVTGLLHTKLKIPGLLSGILSMIALYSINIRIMGKATISLLRMKTLFSGTEARLAATSNPREFAVIAIGLALVVVVVAALCWFFSTELGCAIRATGINKNMVRSQGIHTDNMIILGLVLSNALVALAGALIAQNQRFSDIQMGTGTIVIGLASVIIGEVLFGTKSFFRHLVSLVLGAIAYRVIITIVLELGMQPTDLKLFTALTVALALSLPELKNRLAKRREAKG